MDRLQREVDGNFAAFQHLVGRYLAEHHGEWALMRSGEVVSFHPTAGDAERSGMSRFEDDLFSIQEVTNDVVDLGFFSHVA